MTGKARRAPLSCVCCGKGMNDGVIIVSLFPGETYICSDCIGLAAEIVAEERARATAQGASPNLDPGLGQDCSGVDIRELPWEAP